MLTDNCLPLGSWGTLAIMVHSMLYYDQASHGRDGPLGWGLDQPDGGHGPGIPVFHNLSHLVRRLETRCRARHRR